MPRSMLGRKLEILLVEDSRLDARLTLYALRRSRLRHRLTLVGDGAEAVEFLQRREVYSQAPRPDMILLDLVLPNLDGWEILAEVRRTPELADVPVVVLTGCVDESELDRCRELGVVELLSKPVQVERFLTVVRSLKKRLQNDWQVPEEESE